MTRTDQIDWLLNLHPAIQRWIREQCLPILTNERATRAYADLTLTYGLARLGWTREGCQQLFAEAHQLVDSWNDAHALLFRAYEYRIGQALAGTTSHGPLPADLLEDLSLVSGGPARDRTHSPANLRHAYAVDRLRQHSEILEPDGGVDAFLHGMRNKDSWWQQVGLLSREFHSAIVADRIRNLLQMTAERSPSEQALLLATVLKLAPRLEETLVQELLDQATSLLGTGRRRQSDLLAAALAASAHLGHNERVRGLVTVLHGWLNSDDGLLVARSEDQLLGSAIQALQRLALWEDLRVLVRRLAEVLLQGEDPTRFCWQALRPADGDQRGKREPRLAWIGAILGLLQVANGWFALGQTTPAMWVLDQVRDVLLEDELAPFPQTRIACSYARLLGHLPLEARQRRGEELFLRLENVHDEYSTRDHYLLAPLMLVEALVLGLTMENSPERVALE